MNTGSWEQANRYELIELMKKIYPDFEAKRSYNLQDLFGILRVNLEYVMLDLESLERENYLLKSLLQDYV